MKFSCSAINEALSMEHWWQFGIMEGAFIGYCSWFGQEVWLLQVNLQKAFDSIVFWDSVPQTSIYSNSNSAVVEPPGGDCNILPRSQVPILGLYYATDSTIATSSGSGTCGEQ